MNSKIQNCYISATPGTNLETLVEVLRERGISVVSAGTELPGVRSNDDVIDVLRRVELVIGVVTNERRSQWVLFELGQARALDKQIMLFVPPKSTLAPVGLNRFLVVRSGIRNREATTFAIDQFLAAPTRPLTEGRAHSGNRGGLGALVDELLKELGSIERARDGFALEKFFVRIIRESGVEAISERPARDNGADIAVWADELQSYLGNPLLIEVKADAGSMQDARNTLQRLFETVFTSGATWGLFIYAGGDVDERKLADAAPPNVLTVSARRLLEGMRDRSFTEIVRDLRNRRVHGVGS